jgi:hypothetical protein
MDIDDEPADALAPVDNFTSPDTPLSASPLISFTDPDDDETDEPLDKSMSPLDPLDTTVCINILPDAPCSEDPPLDINTDPPRPDDETPIPADTITLPASRAVPADNEISPPTEPLELDPTANVIDPDKELSELPLDKITLPLAESDTARVCNMTPPAPPRTSLLPKMPESTNTDDPDSKPTPIPLCIKIEPPTDPP